ncbi:MAG TPA: glycosyltransferase [Candidatus Olsenella pullistercoris]|uniref:Glycosyltransferase n=1 Tax=Candidatus Olsenella pullistercoris TaxID=2838712 RepID=A0A9D2JEA9_9ACTN|nr:glycosyltransferase [Candidatus Olsenella pullistercoris]
MVAAPTSVFVSEPRTPAPCVSVLVPICNVERYLEECLNSLVAQTFTDFEAICINDGSTDGSRAIVQRFLDADARFRVIDKPNSGYGASMNLGIANARGSYLAILESDDFFEPDALEKLVGAAERTGADVVKADFWLYWSTPEPRCEPFRIVDDSQAGRTLAPLDDLAVFFRKPSIWSGLYRRDLIERAGIRFLETPGASYQDAGFNFKVLVAARSVSFIADQVLFYRQDNEKSSVNSPAKIFCVCDEYAAMEDYLRNHGSNQGRLLAILERMKFDSYMWNYDRLDEGLREEFVLRAAEEFREAIAAGKVDMDLFEPWSEADLRALVSSPERFNAMRSKHTAPGKLNTFRHYLDLGGLPLVLKVVAYKTFRRSVRRTNESGGAA